MVRFGNKYVQTVVCFHLSIANPIVKAGNVHEHAFREPIKGNGIVTVPYCIPYADAPWEWNIPAQMTPCRMLLTSLLIQYSVFGVECCWQLRVSFVEYCSVFADGSATCAALSHIVRLKSTNAIVWHKGALVYLWNDTD